MSHGRLHKAAGASVTIMLCRNLLSTQGVNSIALVRFCVCLLPLFQFKRDARSDEETSLFCFTVHELLYQEYHQLCFSRISSF